MATYHILMLLTLSDLFAGENLSAKYGLRFVLLLGGNGAWQEWNRKNLAAHWVNFWQKAKQC